MKDITENIKQCTTADGLKEMAKNNGWVFEYDSDTDALYWAPKAVPDNASLVSLNKEFSVYITPQGDVSGVFIEYYQNNFVEHNEKFKEFSDLISHGEVDVEKVRDEEGKKRHLEHYVDDLASVVALAACDSSQKGVFLV